MRNALFAYGVVLAVLLTVGLIAHVEVSLWAECRADHSILYCLRVLGK